MSQDGGGISRRRLLAATGAIGVAAAAVPGVAVAQADPVGRFGAVTVGPGDPRYADLVVGLDRRWVGRPESVRVVSSPRQALDVVQEAVSGRKRLTVRGGGHCYEDFVFNDEVEVVLDLSEMTSVAFDPVHRAFAVEAGATLLDVYELLYKTWGVTIPAGQCYSVGVGGHVAGGGWGLLCRRDGLVVDHLYAVEVVVVDAAGRALLVMATREPDDPHHDLWWAHTGGGGGTFGVVTRYLFRSPGARSADPARILPRPPAELLLSAVAWPWEGMTEAVFGRLVRNWTGWHAANAAPGGRYAGLCSFLLLNQRATGEIGLFTVFDGSGADAEELLSRFVADVTQGVDVPHSALTRPSGEHGPLERYAEPKRWSWLTATRHLGTMHPRMLDPTLRGDHKSAYHRTGFTDAQVATLYRNLDGRDGFANPFAQAMLTSSGGQVNAVGRTDTANVHRDSAFKLHIQTSWSEPSDDDANVSWARRFFAELYARTGKVPVPDERTDGCVLNYPDTDLGDDAHNASGVPWHALYWGENYPRLQRVKAAYDPADFFRHRQSVRLP
ncbi:FAD-binding protein [Saccharothrix sp. S26]|uniref:FAD-binding protein n=1 Tax=Saccharothrix sp. S26 TaxID=2907215 RepID=UPI001F3647DE|nr:FAD-binding protein [Saccharothrix sp. S26]MCE6996410.1 FAD-binding protein [Saccharothrix sp. S26]